MVTSVQITCLRGQSGIPAESKDTLGDYIKGATNLRFSVVTAGGDARDLSQGFSNHTMAACGFHFAKTGCSGRLSHLPGLW